MRWAATRSFAYTLCMANYRLKVLGIPTAIILVCAVFVEAAFHLDQSVLLELAGLRRAADHRGFFSVFPAGVEKTILAYW